MRAPAADLATYTRTSDGGCILVLCWWRDERSWWHPRVDVFRSDGMKVFSNSLGWYSSDPYRSTDHMLQRGEL